MKNITVYDVLVVYTDGIATSASSKKNSDNKPFSTKSQHPEYNDCYAYFLSICRKNGIKAAFTTSKDLSDNGNFNAHWVYERDKWKKITSSCYAKLIFDKFAPISTKQKNRRKSLFGNIGIEPFNSHEVFSLFFDKQKTYDILSKFSIPTVTIKNKSKRSISKAVVDLDILVSKHPKRKDFSRKIVMKDRFGAGGNNIFRTELTGRMVHIQDIMDINKDIAFILQPFTEFEDGYEFKKRQGFVDIRIIYLGAKIIQAYIRTAAQDNFRCNMHQGGNVEYISKKDIPIKIIRTANDILEHINDDSALVALDFIVSNNGNPYLMEGNCGPGLNWCLTIKEDEKYTKKLIREIVGAIGTRIREQRLNEDIVKNSFLNIPLSHPVGITI